MGRLVPAKGGKRTAAEPIMGELAALLSQLVAIVGKLAAPVHPKEAQVVLLLLVVIVGTAALVTEVLEDRAAKRATQAALAEAQAWEDRRAAVRDRVER